MPNKIIITQSNYIPWKGYFTTMKKATHIVLYDDAQYTKRDWRNRNKIITPNGPTWLSIPIDVKGKYLQKINEAKVADRSWCTSHWNKIKQNYKKAPNFKEYSDIFEEIYLRDFPKYDYLTDINSHMLRKCINILGLKTKILDSRDFEITGGKTEKLINICNYLEADEYFTGPAAKGYIEEDLFVKNNIKLSYYNLSGFPEYDQLWSKFEHKVSVIDMFFNLGSKTPDYFNWNNDQCNKKMLF